MIRVVGSGVSDVVEDLFSAEAVAVSHGETAYRAECPFRVDI